MRTSTAVMFVDEEEWPAIITSLEHAHDLAALTSATASPGESRLEAIQEKIDRGFGGETLRDILVDLENDGTDFAADALKSLSRNSPLSMACTVELLHRLRGPSLSIAKALDLEYRFTYRAMEHGDLLEGIRAAIIDKDRNPQWQYADMKVPAVAVSNMLMPLLENKLNLEETS